MQSEKHAPPPERGGGSPGRNLRREIQGASLAMALVDSPRSNNGEPEPETGDVSPVSVSASMPSTSTPLHNAQRTKVKHLTKMHGKLSKGKLSLDSCLGQTGRRKRLEEYSLDEEVSESKLFQPSTSSTEKTSSVTSAKLSKRESLKVQKKNYRSQKKQAAKELLSTLKDPTVVILSDWLKIRGTLKSWTKLWCVLKPGLLFLYKTEKQKRGHWVGTVLLNVCRLIERPSKKDGFCFKLFHPLDQTIWATRGPKGETLGAFVQPLPYSYLIFRAPSENAGKCWMDALELALRCTNLLMRSMTKDRELSFVESESLSGTEQEGLISPAFNATGELLNESDCERHFANQGLDEDYRTDREEGKSESDSSEEEEFDQSHTFNDNLPPVEAPYTMNEVEELGQQGDSCQTEEVNDENKSLIWTLVKQVRPGMDLSKVVLPTFILEPRSFLDKLTDYYYHSDLLSEAVTLENPYARMKSVVRWYLSGFYKKPKGLKKPYNPILGEVMRCYWRNPKNGSRTFYIAEQISHHPPVSAFHVTNRKDGFVISGSILAKSKFYGNSLSAILDGTAKLTFLKRGEDYFITMPYAHCKGILIGTLTMELGGKVTIECPKTGYRAELDFKLKPFLGSGEASNKVQGKIKMGSDTLSTLEGHWDQEIYIKEKTSGEQHLFWNPTDDWKARRLRRFTVPVEVQSDFESERLWQGVSVAVVASDMHGATNEKHLLEERQRQEAKERKAKLQEWIPRFFERDLTGQWIYKYIDLRPWDDSNDVLQYENDFVIRTQTHHKTPVVRTVSLTSLEHIAGGATLGSIAATLSRPSLSVRHHRRPTSGSSTPEQEAPHDSDSSESAFSAKHPQTGLAGGGMRGMALEESLQLVMEPVLESQRAMQRTLEAIRTQLYRVQDRQERQSSSGLGLSRDLLLILAAIVGVQIFLQMLFR